MMLWALRRSQKISSVASLLYQPLIAPAETLPCVLGGSMNLNLGAPTLMGASHSRALSHLGCSTSSQFTPSHPHPAHGRRTMSTVPRTCSSPPSSMSASSSSHPQDQESRNLLGLRGVGPKNANLLLAKRITTVDRLQEIYHTNCGRDKQELLRYLTEVVGIRNRAHCRSVADHLDDLHWEPPPRRVKLAVEGNIGAGKSTFLDILCDGALEMQDIIEVIPEPVNEWQNVRNGEEEPINLLDRFYKDPMKYAYTFQHYVLLTRMEKDRAARSSAKPLHVLERSIFSDRMVFVRAMHDAGFMGDLELSVYDSWFSMEIEQDQELTPDGFIYLKARPETCIKRLRGRNRSEEAGVDAAYLESLHNKHESWLHFGARQLDDVVRDEQRGMMRTVSALQRRSEPSLQISPQLAATSADGRSLRLGVPELSLLEAAPAHIKDNIVFLGGGELGLSEGEGRVARALSGVPALILDHDQDDILHDPAARLDYASKVKAFSDYVQTIKGAVRPSLEMARAGPGQGLSPSQMDSLKDLLKEYRRFVDTSKSGGQLVHPAGRSLAEMEGYFDRLAALGDPGRRGGGGGGLMAGSRR